MFALHTDHAWEDYYITYRSSRNLAEGHGLVFNLGDRLHTFTSPLGVLLPALASKLTGTHSDAGALWVFRVLSAAALGGAAWLLTRALQRRGLPWLGVVLPGAWLVTDAKVLDFTINGMETAFMLLFLAYAVWSHLRADEDGRDWRHLGAAWAGLMWTRPDSFVYIGLFAGGCWLFNEGGNSGRSRGALLKEYFRAGVLTTALYAPWLIFCTVYYGTPVPHTITAKGGISDPHTLAGLLETAIKLPYLAWTRFTSVEGSFLPSYYMLGGWPETAIVAARAVATLAMLVWLLPGVPRFSRAASLTFFGAHVYLTYFPYFPFPWYVPNATVFAALALTGVAGTIAGARLRPVRWGAVALAVVAIGGAAWLTFSVARQVRVQQRLIEDGGRRQVGEWLRAHASASDTVFMEPLGYIGYFSGLKTYDFPGMSSREMVEARRLLGADWAPLILYLQPSWVVLRPREIERVNRTLPQLLSTCYEVASRFDASDALAREDIRGKPYLEHDAAFVVFRRVRPMRHDADFAAVAGPFGWSYTGIDGQEVVSLHAPALMIVKVPPGAARVVARFGFLPGAGEAPNATDGATFTVVHVDGRERRELFSRGLLPTTQTADRHLQDLELELPAGRSPGAVLVFRIYGHRTSDKDWTVWTKPVFR